MANEEPQADPTETVAPAAGRPDNSTNHQKLLLAVLALASVAVIWNFISARQNEEPSFEEQQAADALYRELTQVEVVIYVEGTASTADLTLGVNGSVSQQANVYVPAKDKRGRSGLRIDAQMGDSIYLSAQQDEKTGRTITCRIEVNGRVIDESSSQGAFTIATCTGVA